VSRPAESIAEPVGLDAVLTTEELARRPARPPGHTAEAKALAALDRTLAESPRSILQNLVDLALELCRADSTGVSILKPGGAASVFRWPAIAGQFAANLNGTMPRDASPCGTVLDRNSALLFVRPERHFAYPDVDPRSSRRWSSSTSTASRSARSGRSPTPRGGSSPLRTPGYPPACPGSRPSPTS